ncbi:UmuC domain-containing protein [Balamuthia mandrillaris]
MKALLVVALCLSVAWANHFPAVLDDAQLNPQMGQIFEAPILPEFTQARLGWDSASTYFDFDVYPDTVVSSPGIAVLMDGKLVPEVGGIAFGISSRLDGLSGSSSSFSGSSLSSDEDGLPTFSFLPGLQEGDNFGYALAVGDVNGDGLGDVASCWTGTLSGLGGCAVVLGNPSGEVPPTLAHLNGSNGFCFTSTAAHDNFGTAVTVGDINNDGYGDLCVGAHGQRDAPGHVHCLFGRSSFAALYDTDSLAEVEGDEESGENGFTIVGQGSDDFGYSLSWVDFDGNGRVDLVVGSPDHILASEDESVESSSEETLASAPGAIYVIRNADLWSSVVSVEQLMALEQAFIVVGSQDGQRFGEALATGDLDADGFGDIAVGAPLTDLAVEGEEEEETELTNAGAVFVIFGKGGYLPATLEENSFFTFLGRFENDRIGSRRTLAFGDINNDDKDDFYIGAPFAKQLHSEIFPESDSESESQKPSRRRSLATKQSEHSEQGFGSDSLVEFDGEGSDDEGPEEEEEELINGAGYVAVIYGRCGFFRGYVMDVSFMDGRLGFRFTTSSGEVTEIGSSVAASPSVHSTGQGSALVVIGYGTDVNRIGVIFAEGPFLPSVEDESSDSSGSGSAEEEEEEEECILPTVVVSPTDIRVVAGARRGTVVRLGQDTPNNYLVLIEAENEPHESNINWIIPPAIPLERAFAVNLTLTYLNAGGDRWHFFARDFAGNRFVKLGSTIPDLPRNKGQLETRTFVLLRESFGEKEVDGVTDLIRVEDRRFRLHIRTKVNTPTKDKEFYLDEAYLTFLF